MLIAFFESVKYVGHLVPLAFLRIYIGYVFFDSALTKAQGDYLMQPQLAASVSEWLPLSPAPDWMRDFLENIVVPNWKIFAYTLTYCEFLIGISFLLGFLVRPIGLLGAVLCLTYIYASGQPAVELHEIYFALFISMLWMGAGRSLGVDYFFYKRRRGIWW